MTCSTSLVTGILPASIWWAAHSGRAADETSKQLYERSDGSCDDLRDRDIAWRDGARHRRRGDVLQLGPATESRRRGRTGRCELSCQHKYIRPDQGCKWMRYRYLQ